MSGSRRNWSASRLNHSRCRRSEGRSHSNRSGSHSNRRRSRIYLSASRSGREHRRRFRRGAEGRSYGRGLTSTTRFASSSYLRTWRGPTSAYGPPTVGAPDLLAGAFAVAAPRPAARPTLAFLKLLLSSANAAFSGHLLLGILDPADELVAGQRRHVLPGMERRRVRDQSFAQVFRKLVHHATGHSLTHKTTVAAILEAREASRSLRHVDRWTPTAPSSFPTP
jgi:hypothetical protein